MNKEFDNITIMKYRIGDKYSFLVLDKFNEPNETKRFDMMMEKHREMMSKYTDYDMLWIKTTPIV